jgi:hypothetical protein
MPETMRGASSISPDSEVSATALPLRARAHRARPGADAAGPSPLLDQRVPLAAAVALAGPAGVHRAAILADELDAGLSHRQRSPSEIVPVIAAAERRQHLVGNGAGRRRRLVDRQVGTEQLDPVAMRDLVAQIGDVEHGQVHGDAPDNRHALPWRKPSPATGQPPRASGTPWPDATGDSRRHSPSRRPRSACRAQAIARGAIADRLAGFHLPQLHDAGLRGGDRCIGLRRIPASDCRHRARCPAAPESKREIGPRKVPAEFERLESAWKSPPNRLKRLELPAVERMRGIVGAGQMAHDQKRRERPSARCRWQRRGLFGVRPSRFMPVSTWIAQGRGTSPSQPCASQSDISVAN